MWYTSEILVKQLDTFYDQVDSTGNVKATSTRDGLDKIDKNTYVFKAALGEVFYSIERKKPEVGDCRYIYDAKFEPHRVTKVGIWPFTKYKISWTSRKLDAYEAIAKFYKQYMWKQLPTGPQLKATDARKDR